jgi:hypothetical protein
MVRLRERHALHSFARNETLGKGRHERTDDGEHTDTDKDTIIPANNA